tara:strand:- start:28 stop:423 length:396 start_codon:yes stop_codon:yes gene_type:complete
MPKPNSSSTVREIKAYIRMKKLNQPELKLSLGKDALVAGLKKHGHWSSKGSKESAGTKASTRPAGQGGMAKRTGGAPRKRWVYPKSGNKPKGMTITEWRTDKRNPTRSREVYSGKSGRNPGRIGGSGGNPK